MKPGRELDALVAEKVMGWAPAPGVPECFKAVDQEGARWAESASIAAQYEAVPRYSTDIASAWEVVEKFRTEGLVTLTGFMSAGDDDGYRCEFFGYRGADAPTMPYAICLAALKAVGAL